MDTGAAIGWGEFALERLTADGAGRHGPPTRRSPRRTAPSTTPVCHLIRGVLEALAAVTLAGTPSRGRDRVRRDGRRRLPLRNASVTTAALIHVVVSGLATGSIYALMALSLVIIYNATRTLNFAQGEMLMVSTFVAWSAQRAAGAAAARRAPGGGAGRRRCWRSSSSGWSSGAPSAPRTGTC